MFRLDSRIFTVDGATRLHEPPWRVDPDPQLEGVAQFCKIAGAVVVLAMVLAATMTISGDLGALHP
jgi:hypothetical protein